MENLLVSACLLGNRCKYNGKANTLPDETLNVLREKYKIIPVCPETSGGLPIPRIPSERQGDRVVNKACVDVTEEYRKGAECALILARRYGCKKALFKEKSPSCGSGRIYDGSFTGTVISGDGVTSELLKRNGIEIFGESEIDLLLSL